MSFDRISHCRLYLRKFFAGTVACFSLVFAANVLAQETVGTTAAPNSQPVTEIGADANAPTLNPTADSNLHTTTGVQNEVSSEPRRFQYGLQITVRGVYDDNINISQTNRVSDYYFTI